MIFDTSSHIQRINAVALKYDREKMAAPVVVVKGYDEIAQLTKEHGVIMVENVPLAQALAKEVEIGKPVPTKFVALRENVEQDFCTSFGERHETEFIK